ncbi:DNA mismatch repair protein MSH6 [Glycine max]|nr:DNA mismatch repair protein MSH6 [Glycine max]
MASEEKKLENQLLKVGNKLLKPPSSTNGLLYLLNRVKSLLERVEQSPTKSLQDALSPSLKALIGDALLRHADIEVKVTVASCVIDIVRISAPEIPYDDDQMKEVLPIARRLAESVLESCATILRPYLKQVVNTLGISLDDYSDVLVSICQEKIVYENLKELAPPQQDKPISLKLLEASKSSNLTIEKEPKKLIDFREGTKDMDKMSNTKAYGAKLVGTRVKVWWPDDKMFYEGVVSYFYAPRNMHKIVYDDGEEEYVILKEEKWKIIKTSDNLDTGEGTYCTCHDALKDL